GFLTKVGQGLGLATMASIYAEAQNVPAPTNLRIFAGALSTKPVLSKDDFTYLGCMRRPAETFNTVGDMSSSYAALAPRKVNGTLQFFMTGSTVPKTGGSQNGQDDVFEFADPGSYSMSYASAPRASLARTWGSIYQGKRTSWDASGNQLNLQYMLT